MALTESISVKWDEEFQLVISRGKHKVVIDRPALGEDENDHDEVVGPIDLFITGLGACIMSVTASFLSRRDIPFQELRAVISWDYVENPYRIGNIKVELKLPENMEKKVCMALEKVTKACTVHNTLTHPPQIDVGVDACLLLKE